MPRYIDTGTKRPRQDVGHWLEDNVVAGIRGFRCQFGYFRFSAVSQFSEVIHAVAEIGDPVHFVLGSNNGSLIGEDAQRTLRVADGRDTSLTIVAFANAEYHPKTLHIVRADGSSTAVVGSSNLTGRGLGRNVEASVIFDSNQDDPAELQAIADAVDRWHLLPQNELRAEGVYRISSDADLQDLANKAIINVPQPVRRTVSGRRTPAGNALATRDATWTPTAGGWSPTITAPLQRPQEIEVPNLPVVTTSAPEGPAPSTAIVMRWCKKLEGSDSQRPDSGSNPTGKLRLAKAGHPIDKNTWFRYDFFNTVWQQRTHQGQTLDVTHVMFDVRVRGQSRGQQTLTVDHGLHRIANQNNIPTILSWGSELNQELRDNDHVGDWVVLTRDVNGRFALTIQNYEPHWAP